jgi:hypothetical protein
VAGDAGQREVITWLAGCSYRPHHNVCGGSIQIQKVRDCLDHEIVNLIDDLDQFADQRVVVIRKYQRARRVHGAWGFFG